ncbi:MAG: GDSL-type esterase/lipase family protein, partial [Psychromonas sp.]
MKRTVFLLLVLVFLSACSDPAQKLTPLIQTRSILAFGDSLTFGYGATTEQSYPAQLSSLINVPVINAGISGELSEQGLKRLESLLELHNPQLLLLCHGGNDILKKRDLNVMADNLKEMIKLAQHREIPV